MPGEESPEAILEDLKKIAQAAVDVIKAFHERAQRMQQMKISAEQHSQSMQQQADLQKQQLEGMKEAFSKALKEAGIDPDKQQQQGQQTSQQGQRETVVSDATKKAEKLAYEESVKLDKLADREDQLNARVGEIDKRLDQLKKQEGLVKDLAKAQGHDPSKLDEVWRSIQKEGSSLEQEKVKLGQDLDGIANERIGILKGDGIGKQLKDDYQKSVQQEIDKIGEQQKMMKAQSTEGMSPSLLSQRDKSLLDLQKQKVDLQIEKRDMQRAFKPGSVGETLEKQGYKFGQKPSIGTGVRVK